MKSEKNFSKNITLSKLFFPPEHNPNSQIFQFTKSPIFLQSLRETSNPSATTFQDLGAKCNFHFFHLYMITGYYIGVLPYKPVFHSESGRYRLEGNKFGKILCLVFYILAVFNRLSILRTTWQTTGLHPTIFYFNLAHAHSHLILNLLFYFILFTKEKEFREMISTVGHCSLLYFPQKFQLRWGLIIVTQVCWIVKGFICPIIGYDVIDSWDWEISWLWRSYVSKSKFTFFISSNATQVKVPPELDQIAGWDIALALLQVLTLATHELQTRYLISAVGIACFTIWNGAKNYIDHLVPSNSSDQGEETGEEKSEENKDILKAMIHGFGQLRALADAVNRPWHLLCFWYMFDITVWLATDLDRALRTNDWFIKSHIFYFLIYTGTALTLSAESFRKMNWLRQWLYTRRNWEHVWSDRKEMKLLHQEVLESTVGIGAPGFFQIDYTFLSHVAVMVVTFFIISLQYAKF